MIPGLRAAAEVGLLVPPPFQYWLFLACAAGLLVILTPMAIAVSLRLRALPGAENLKTLRWYLRSSILYLVVNSLEVLAPTAAATLFFMQLCYLFILSIPIRLFLFSLSITGRSVWIPRPAFLPWVLPAIAFLIAFTNRYHHLNWGELVWFRSGPFLLIRALSYGPWFWLIWVSMEIAVVVGCALTLVSVLTHAQTPNRHSLIILVGTLVPIVVNAVYVLRLVDGWQKDFSAIAFGVSGILFAVGVLHDQLFSLVPIARRNLVEALVDPLVLVDVEGRVVDANPAALSVWGVGSGLVGLHVQDEPFLAAMVERLADVSSATAGGGGGAEMSPDGERWYEVRAIGIHPKGNHPFRLYALRDITESRRLMEEKSALADRLSRALAEIRTLQGIVPICSSCKKIRDDNGYWQQVENYVSSHTMAEFSLGLCPSCQNRLYPEQGGMQ